jgi:hypothetical protein
MAKFIILLVLLIPFFTLSSGQTFQYKTYKDTIHKISFDIPTYWTIKYSKEQDGVICTPITKQQKEIYNDCFEGIVFRIDFDNYGLDTLLFKEFEKIGDNYVTSDRIRNNVPVRFINGKNWKGVRHDNVCGISCKENGFHAGGGECQFFYFCSANKTVTIQTYGRSLDDKVAIKLLSSFRFLD